MGFIGRALLSGAVWQGATWIGHQYIAHARYANSICEKYQYDAPHPSGVKKNTKDYNSHDFSEFDN